VSILSEESRKIKNQRIDKGNNKLIKSGDRVDVTRAVVTLACQNLLHGRLGFFPRATPKLEEFSTYLDIYLRISILVFRTIPCDIPM